jgi:hypothetical protein
VQEQSLLGCGFFVQFMGRNALANDLARGLVDDYPTTIADIQAIPRAAHDRLHFATSCVAFNEPIIARRIAAPANPVVTITLPMFDPNHGLILA